MAADVSFGDEIERPVAGSIATLPLDESRDRLAREYLRKLLKNIKIMLAYATSNGIALPDDLRPKIDALLTHPDVSNDPATPSLQN